jgi:hypothetical protein
MLQESQVERCEHQDDSYIHHQPFPEPVPEEQDIHTDYDGCQQRYVKYDRCLSRHFSHQSKSPTMTKAATMKSNPPATRSAGFSDGVHSGLDRNRQ